MTTFLEARVVVDMSLALFRRAVDCVLSERVVSKNNERTRVIANECRAILATPDDDLAQYVPQIVSAISNCIDSQPSRLPCRENTWREFLKKGL